jgi:hypothetical protein
MSNDTFKSGTLWHKNNSPVSVKIVSSGFIRVGMGKSTKTPAVVYQSLHDGEVTARAEKEFKRMFNPA